MCSNKKPHVLPLILGVALTALPATAATTNTDEPGPIRLISVDLFEALEGWSEPTASLETVVLESYPEAVIGYAGEVESIYGGLTMSEHFTRSYPETVETYRSATDGGVEDEADFLAFVMSAEQPTYQRWQQEDALRGATFPDYIERNHPSALVDVERNETPAERGVTLAQHVREIGREDLLDELYGVLDTLGGNSTRCECWTVATFPRNPNEFPGPWRHEINQDIDSGGNKLEYDVFAEGAAKNIDFYRESHGNVWEVIRSKNTNYTHLRVRMHCTMDGVPGGSQCEGSTCTGELAMRAEYASRVFQKVEVGGIFSRNSRILTSDMAELTYDPPGPAPEMELFHKGVAVSGDSKTNWNAGAAWQILTSAAGIAAAFAGDETSIGDLLEGDLVNDAIEGFGGLITREGEESEHSQDMFVAFDTAGTAPLPLIPNTTHLFQLNTSSDFDNRGYGPTSKAWGNVDSSHFISAVARNYQCAPDVTAPTPQAFWFYDGSGLPHSTTTLRNLVDAFVTTEMGVSPTGLHSRQGQYP